MNESKLNQVKFGIAGALVSFISTLLIEIFLWIKVFPAYNNLFISIYGVSQTSQVLQMFFITLIVMIIFGFAMAWLFAKLYNSLPNFKFQ